MRVRVQIVRELGDDPDWIFRSGSGASVVFEKSFFFGRILECDPPISAGQSGSVILGIIDEGARHFAVGTEFEIRASDRKAATARIVEVLEE